MRRMRSKGTPQPTLVFHNAYPPTQIDNGNPTRNRCCHWCSSTGDCCCCRTDLEEPSPSPRPPLPAGAYAAPAVRPRCRPRRHTRCCRRSGTVAPALPLTRATPAGAPLVWEWTCWQRAPQAPAVPAADRPVDTAGQGGCPRTALEPSRTLFPLVVGGNGKQAYPALAAAASPLPTETLTVWPAERYCPGSCMYPAPPPPPPAPY
jgi:hypothetical protein